MMTESSRIPPPNLPLRPRNLSCMGSDQFDDWTLCVDEDGYYHYVNRVGIAYLSSQETSWPPIMWNATLHEMSVNAVGSLGYGFVSFHRNVFRKIIEPGLPGTSGGFRCSVSGRFYGD